MFDFLRKKTPSSKEYLLGLVVKEDEGEVIIFAANKLNQSVEIVDQKKFSYTNSWENLVDDIDANLFELEQKNDVHVEKAVFFLYSHLIDQSTHQIQKPYLSKIKAIIDELELTIEGYAEFHESIALHLARIEHAPLTAVIAEVDNPAVSLFIYKGGKLMASQTVSKTENIVSDFEEMFTKLKSDYLPTRIILYDSTNLQDESTKLISHSWKEGLFMQIPKFEIYTKEKIYLALVESFSHKLFGEDAEPALFMTENREKASADVSESETQLEVESEQDGVKNTEVDGFLIGKDIQVSEKKEGSIIIDDPFSKSYMPSQNWFKKVFSTVQLSIQSMSTRIFNSQQNTKPKTALMFSIIGLILIFISITSVLYYLHKARVTVFFKGNKIEKELTIDAVIGEGSKTKLGISKSSDSVEASESTDTSGKKKIGDKAKGSATIFNMQTQEKTLKKGTVFQTDSGVLFILDSDVKVASASSTLTGEGNVTIITGKQKAGLTASDIGNKGNISKDTKLKIEGISSEDMRAQAESVFTGGSEKEVRTVSKEDMTRLQSAVEKKIRSEGDEIVRKTTSGKRTIANLTTISPKEKKYSKELAEEAENVSLTMKSDVEFYTYNEDALKKILSIVLNDVVEDDFELDQSNINYTIKEVEQKDDQVTLNLAIEARPHRKVDKQKIVSNISGKSVSKLEQIIKDQYNGVGYEAHVESPIPPLRSLIPFFSKNIEVNVKSL